ncbi:MAG: response regulator [Phycisphaerales bacterium]|nr:MAG: response regulator [Phycisphaerales bacterium]
MKILLVDDSETMRNIQKNILDQLGYTEIEEACDGQDALDKASVFKPDLILLACKMPNVDGLTFARTYRSQGNNTPIIMVTTEAEKTRVIEAIKAGVDNYVIKPFTPEVLAKRVEETMTKARAA